MRWSDIPFHPEPRTLRQFAGLWVAFFLTLAVWQHWALGVVAVVGLAGLVWPGLMRPLFVGWMVLVFPIGWVVARVLLALVFYVIVTPIGLGLRLTGRDALGRRLRPESDSYWEPRAEATSSSSYYRQF